MAADWLGFVKTIAPTVASALLGPLGGAAVAAIGGIIGVSDATQDTIKRVITDGQITQEQLGKFRELELQYKAEERERTFKYAELEFQDTKSARDMQATTRSWVPGALSVFVTFGFFGILAYMLSGDYRPSDALLVMLGSLGTAWTSIVAFWFGSSHGSTAKTQMLMQNNPSK